MVKCRHKFITYFFNNINPNFFISFRSAFTSLSQEICVLGFLPKILIFVFLIRSPKVSVERYSSLLQCIKYSVYSLINFIITSQFIFPIFILWSQDFLYKFLLSFLFLLTIWLCVLWDILMRKTPSSLMTYWSASIYHL